MLHFVLQVTSTNFKTTKNFPQHFSGSTKTYFQLRRWTKPLNTSTRTLTSRSHVTWLETKLPLESHGHIGRPVQLKPRRLPRIQPTLPWTLMIAPSRRSSLSRHLDQETTENTPASTSLRRRQQLRLPTRLLLLLRVSQINKLLCKGMNLETTIVLLYHLLTS